MTAPKPATPGVRFPPPFLYLAGLGAAWLLETRIYRIRLVQSPSAVSLLENTGIALLLAGLVLIFWGMLTFARAKTAILPMRPASRVVTHGPYRFTRNPMYSGMAVSYLGGAIGMNSGWSLIFFPFVIALLYWLVITREERYLSSEFGEDYDAYRQRVRRWI
jgi:protein-S-isoprenylcysteine O-methyltransferase Ste14